VRQLQDADEHNAAISLGRRALTIRTDALRSDHPIVAESLNNLGLSLVCTGAFDEAGDLLSRAAAIRPDFPNPHYWIARLHRTRGAVNDRELEVAAWCRYLELGPTIPERGEEARARLHDLHRAQRRDS
jgi:hypothetical protein